jgi:hypothetical protein
MKYNFDLKCDRSNTNCVKWDAVVGCGYGFSGRQTHRRRHKKTRRP